MVGSHFRGEALDPQFSPKASETNTFLPMTRQLTNDTRQNGSLCNQLSPHLIANQELGHLEQEGQVKKHLGLVNLQQ